MSSNDTPLAEAASVTAAVVSAHKGVTSPAKPPASAGSVKGCCSSTSSSSSSSSTSSSGTAAEVDWETRLVFGLLLVSTATLVYSGIQYYYRSERRRAVHGRIDRTNTSLEISARGWRKHEETPDSSGGALRPAATSLSRKRSDSSSLVRGSSSMLGLTTIRSLSNSLFGGREEKRDGSAEAGLSTLESNSDTDSDSSEDGNTSLVTYLSKSRVNATFLMKCDLRQAYPRDYKEIYSMLDRSFEGGKESKLLRKLHKTGEVSFEYTVTYESRIIAYMCVTQVYARAADSDGKALELTLSERGLSLDSEGKLVTLDEDKDESSDDEEMHTASFVSKTQHTLERYDHESPERKRVADLDTEGVSVSAPAMLLSGTSGLSSKSSELVGLGIGPICVDEEYRRQRLASYMIETLAAQVNMYPYLVVLGEPAFYSRLSFKAAGKFGLRSKWTDLSSENFMVRFLSKSRVLNFLSHSKSESRQFIIEYSPEFDMFDDVLSAEK